LFVLLTLTVVVTAAGGSPGQDEMPGIVAELPPALPEAALGAASADAVDATADVSLYDFVGRLSDVIAVPEADAELNIITRTLPSATTGTGDAEPEQVLNAPDAPRKPNTALTGFVLLIDAGHGLVSSPGVTGPTGLKESEVVLDVADRLRVIANNAGANVTMTRVADLTDLSNKARANIANSISADAFVRIHAEGYSDPAASGIEVLWLKDDSRVLAEEIALELSSSTGLLNMGANQVTGFEALMDAMVPSVQISVGAISNGTTEGYLRSADNREKVAESLYRGIVKYAHGG